MPTSVDQYMLPAEDGKEGLPVRLYDNLGNSICTGAASDGAVAANTPLEALGLFNGSTLDRARAVNGDAEPAIGLGAEVPMLWNGATYDRLKGYLGAELSTLPAVQTANLLASAAQTTSGNTADLVTPPYTAAIFVIRVSALSGTSPSMTVTVKTKLSDGTYTSAAGQSTSAITAVGNFGITICVASTSQAALLGPVYQLAWAISGTSPSFTFFVDMFWK